MDVDDVLVVEESSVAISVQLFWPVIVVVDPAGQSVGILDPVSGTKEPISAGMQEDDPVLG